MARTKPPLLPEEALYRAVKTARMDGTLVLAIAGTLALLSALDKDRVGALVGIIVSAAGAIELHGTSLLRAGFHRGVRWLVGSQLYLLAIVVGWAAYRLGHPDLEPVHKAIIEGNILTDQQRDAIKQSGMSLDQFLLAAYRLGYAAVIIATLLYQGGMALYYARRGRQMAPAFQSTSTE